MEVNSDSENDVDVSDESDGEVDYLLGLVINGDADISENDEAALAVTENNESWRILESCDNFDTSQCPSTSNTSSPTAYTNWNGKYKFSVSFDCSRSCKSPLFSQTLQKLFIRKDCVFDAQISAHQVPSGCIVRATAFYNSSEDTSIVTRCSNHAMKDKLNGKREFEHFIQSPNADAVYEKNKENGVLSVSIPFKANTGKGSYQYKYKCTCLSSCSKYGKPYSVHFTLENRGKILGRQILHISVTVSPLNDIRLEKEKLNISKSSPIKAKSKDIENTYAQSEAYSMELPAPIPSCLPNGITKKVQSEVNNCSLYEYELLPEKEKPCESKVDESISENRNPKQQVTSTSHLQISNKIINIDSRNIKRGRCLMENCDCDLYEYQKSKGLMCAYCFCPPAKHTRIETSVKKPDVEKHASPKAVFVPKNSSNQDHFPVILNTVENNQQNVILYKNTVKNSSNQDHLPVIMNTVKNNEQNVILYKNTKNSSNQNHMPVTLKTFKDMNMQNVILYKNTVNQFSKYLPLKLPKAVENSVGGKSFTRQQECIIVRSIAERCYSEDLPMKYVDFVADAALEKWKALESGFSSRSESTHYLAVRIKRRIRKLRNK